MRYQRKINYVDAIQFTGDNWKQLEEFVSEENIIGYIEDIHSKEVKRYSIKTPNGSAGVGRGDWVCRDVKGGVYPCTDEVFKATYYVKEDPHRCRGCPECAVIFDSKGIYGHVPDHNSKTCQSCERFKGEIE